MLNMFHFLLFGNKDLCLNKNVAIPTSGYRDIVVPKGFSVEVVGISFENGGRMFFHVEVLKETSFHCVFMVPSSDVNIKVRTKDVMSAIEFLNMLPSSAEIIQGAETRNS